MNYSLASFTSMGPAGGPDLIESLRKRRASQRDFTIRADDVEFESRTCVRVGAERLAARPDALAGFERHRAKDRLLVRLEGGEVRAILPAESRLIGNLDLLEEVVRGFEKASTEIRIEHCREEEGELYLTAVAPQLAAEAGVGDYLYGGFILSNSETALLDTEACPRIFRVACSNGALTDFNEGNRLVLPRILEASCPDPYVSWKAKLGEVIARSFDGGVFDEDSRRFRATIEQILATPYEYLLNLAAQGLITDEEQVRIQREFRDADDLTMYGLINAVTRIAHGMRAGNDVRRASDIERLAGEIIRGDHEPPVLDPAYRS